MRKLILVAALLVAAMSSYGQALPAPEKTPEELLKIGKSQTTAGWVVGLGGLALVLAGAASYESELDQWLQDKETDNTLAGTMLGVGCAAMVGSVFLIVAGNRTKNKARYLEMTSHLTRIPQPGTSGSSMQPGLSLKVTF